MYNVKIAAIIRSVITTLFGFVYILCILLQIIEGIKIAKNSVPFAAIIQYAVIYEFSYLAISKKFPQIYC